MIAALVSIPVLCIAIIVQSAIISRLPLLFGSGDLVLLVLVAWGLQERVTTAWFWMLVGGALVSLVSAIPFFVPFMGYGMVTLMVYILQRRVWQTPILVMFVATMAGTIIYHIITIFVLKFSGTPLDWVESLTLVTLSSSLINLLLALPVYAVMVELANWLYPAREEE